MEIHANNVNDAYAAGLMWLANSGKEMNSRNGKVIVSPEPVMTIYRRPWERVLFSPSRDANPFFHVLEAMWMLAGKNDIATPTFYNKNYLNYSDDGVTQHGAYGYRWRTHFGYDQLKVIIKELRANPETRRAVLAMWDASINDVYCCRCDKTAVGGDDLNYAVTPGSKDAPCNTHAYFDAIGGKVNLTVCCRSNDIIWGCYGANAVHFSFLQEYVAAMVGLPPGVYRQFSNNFHLYPEVLGNIPLFDLATDAEANDQYKLSGLVPKKLVDDPKTFDEDLKNFFENGTIIPFRNSFFGEVALPMRTIYTIRKKKIGTGIDFLKNIKAEDWARAASEWIERRERKKNETRGK